MRQSLIIGEVALALVLLGGAGIMQQGFAGFLKKEVGWDSSRILSATLPVPESKFENSRERTEYFRALERQLIELPGVEKAAITTSLPIWGYNGQRQILLDGQSPAAATQLPSAFHVMITPDYFSTVGVRLLHGREFAETDDSDSPRVIVVNEALARRLWPGESAIGKRLGSMDSGDVYWAEVVGIVSDVEAVANLSYPSTTFHVYKPMPQEPWGWVHLVIRTAHPETMAESMRKAVTNVDPDLPVDQVATVQQYVDQGMHNLRLAGKTLNWFALLGLLLAALGIYGVISNLVAQRTSEFGIRMALGAQPSDVMKLVLRNGLILTIIGLVIGLGGAYGLAQFLSAAMPRLANPNLPVLLAVALVLLAVSTVACWIPARRSTARV
jgi:predicted permease